MHRIFIVEDDAAIAAALQKHLTTWGFDVRCAEDFRNVLTECTAFDPQLVLLDITLPFYNGYHWCQELRRVSNVPVVFISSASDNMNIVWRRSRRSCAARMILPRPRPRSSIAAPCSTRRMRA